MRSKLPSIERKQLVELSEKTLLTDDGKEALTYLKSVRKLSDATIRKFRLGYVPHWIQNLHGDRHELAGRLTIPIYDQYADLIAVSSRDWREDAYQKFWHESFHKGLFLFGINLAKNQIIKRSKAVIVEGEFDVMSLANNGFTFTVGQLGSAPQLYQVALLSRYCSEIFILCDSDPSGDIAKDKLLKLSRDNQLFEVYGVNVIPVQLPVGQDPDEFIRKEGRDALLSVFREARAEIYKMKGLSNNVSMA